MPFVKVIKNKAYFKRFQVKFRRRREGKTDYYARKRLIAQDKNKYNSPKYRLVARLTNKDVICQITYATMVGDKVLCCAYSHELPRYGVKVGLTNYSAAYATGLLVARRTLDKLNLADKYAGQTKPDGQDFNVEELEDGPRPFLALLDTGLRRTSTGAKIFAMMKGASDGGLEVPHSETRFVGYDREGKTLNAETLRKYIFGGHVADYMRHLQEEDSAKYEKHFSKFIKAGLNADKLEAMYANAHKAIRADPKAKLTTKKPTVKKHFSAVKLTYEERKKSLAERKKRLGITY